MKELNMNELENVTGGISLDELLQRHYELEQLRDHGIITPEEFSKEVRALLNQDIDELPNRKIS